MKFFAYTLVFVCAILALAAGEPLGRVQRSPVPIPDPNGWGYGGWGHGGHDYYGHGHYGHGHYGHGHYGHGHHHHHGWGR